MGGGRHRFWFSGADEEGEEWIRDRVEGGFYMLQLLVRQGRMVGGRGAVLFILLSSCHWPARISSWVRKIGSCPTQISARVRKIGPCPPVALVWSDWVFFGWVGSGLSGRAARDQVHAKPEKTRPDPTNDRVYLHSSPQYGH